MNLGSAFKQSKRENKLFLPGNTDVVEDVSSNCKCKGAIATHTSARTNVLKSLCNVRMVKVCTFPLKNLLLLPFYFSYFFTFFPG